jgi:hypothetical protein
MQIEQPDTLLRLIEHRFTQAVSAHNALSLGLLGNGRTAQPMHVTLTYAEGQLVELSRLRRLVRRLGRVSSPVALRIVEDDICHWRSMFAKYADADKPSMVSLAYTNGALEAAESTLIAIKVACCPEDEERYTG